MTALLLDHLWQSTLFAAAAGVLTLAFTANSAAVRYWLWFAASVKFLVPFSAVTALGTYLFQSLAPRAPPPIFFDLQPAAAPFSGATPVLATPLLASPAAQGIDWAPLLLSLWALGFAVILAVWLGRWLKLRAALAGATSLSIDAPMPVKSSAASLEPGLIGIWRPVLLLPLGIETHLSLPEMRAILVHEDCHLRRRDNLLAAIHMAVEAVFWFHPLVWWLGARLIAERENACDEAVLSSGSDPQTYAESILKVCQFYLHSPLDCASGVSGADLKKRIAAIMESKFAIRLNTAKKGLLAACAATAIAAPLALGLLTAPQASAQAQTSANTPPSPEDRAQNLAEQRRPRTVVPFDPKQFDKFVGFYQLRPDTFFTISRDGDHFISRLTGQLNVEIYPESPTKFFATIVAAQISFDIDAQGNVTGLVLHQGGIEQPAKKVAESVAKSSEAAIEQRIKNNTPSPGTEAALRQFIDSIQKGRPNYDGLIPSVAANHRQIEYIDVHRFQSLGGLKSLTFVNVNSQGMDVYSATFELARAEFVIPPLSQDGKIGNFGWRVVESTDPVVLQHIRDNKPSSGTEEALRRQVEALENGRPDYEAMTPALAAAVREQPGNSTDLIKKWGPLKSITFNAVGQPMGNEVFALHFEHEEALGVISPLTHDGKIPGLYFQDTGGIIYGLP